MRRGSIFLALLLCCPPPVAAQESPAEPSAMLCDDFKLEATHTLSQSPDSLQINNLLFEAARKGCVSALDVLIKAGASPLARDRMGNVALAIAARMGRVAFVKALLADKANAEQLNRPNVAGSTPLFQAVQADRTAVAKLLIDAEAKVDIANKQGETALSRRLQRQCGSRRASPRPQGAAGNSRRDRQERYRLCRCARRHADRGNVLGAGVDPNRRYNADLTALMWAAGHADNTPREQGLRTVKLLIERGATIDLVDDRGRSALMIAAGLDHGAIAQALLDAGADRSKRDKTGKSAADLAGGPEAKAIVATP
jgi:ankyrin repeat protein